MREERCLELKIVHDEPTEPLSDAVIRALWELISAPNPFAEEVAEQLATVYEAGLFDKGQICITSPTNSRVSAYGAALETQVSQTSQPPLVEFEI